MSTPSPRFLLDENVRSELGRFLRSCAVDIKRAPPSTPDALIASLSKKEKRIVVTNDIDFCKYGKEEIFGLIWLRIPQNNPNALVMAFEKLLDQFKDFPGRLVVLEINKWADFPLAGIPDIES